MTYEAGSGTSAVADQFVKPDLSRALSVHDFEAIAAKTLNPKAWAFISSAATDLYTKTRNASTYSKITLRPRILRDVSSVDLSTQLLGHKLRVPIFASPTAMAAMVHPEGEKAVGRAVKASGMAHCISMSASFPLKDIVEDIHSHSVAVPHDTPIFLQFYVNKDRVLSEALLKQAKEFGATALFLTVDAASTGKREADERVQISEKLASPASGVTVANDSKGGGLGRSLGSFIDNSVTWDDIKWIRQHAPGLKLVLKGIQTAEDAVMAMDAGVDGILISNHGGRTLDTAPASILVLLELHRHCPQIFERLDVMVDGGITRGTDIFKALCLGAKAVGLGRSTLYGLNYGYEGVVKLFEILRDELEATMKLCGVTTVDQLHAGYLNTLEVDHAISTVAGTKHLKSRL
ncbi:Aldolase-type TIM barrel [Akanthomyces lecanii RCEF 1005]|uniref:L-lactate dehydrogenase (cytochrome) n=1 Tax=Akanthomyces lecanii RCEF 1005 TaxID=1081108 RepID=A0A162K5H1_CORDF|nr:Aldolase-type TIM barrel [Akanthomyces lecanii RCEF 1005]